MNAATEDRSVEETNRHQIDQYQSIIRYISRQNTTVIMKQHTELQTRIATC